MLPLIAHDLLDSIALLANAMTRLADAAIAGLRGAARPHRRRWSRNPILVDRAESRDRLRTAARIAKRAYAEGRAVFDVAKELTNLTDAQLHALLDPAVLARGGIHGEPGGSGG
jgi:fumarate hydratase class II